jgi:hypothetical protein
MLIQSFKFGFGEPMRKVLSLILLSSPVLFAQAAPAPQSNVAPPVPPAVQAAAEVPPNAAVITLHGLCPDKPAADPKSAECQTIVTRAEFEHLAETLSPNMPGSAKQSLANDYARMLVISTEARKRGIENSEHFKDLVSFVKLQLLAQELFRSFQEQARPSAAAVEKNYNDNANKYEELSLKRLFIPRNRPDQAQALQKPGSPPTAPQQPTDAELQAEGEKLRDRLEAGNDFDTLQKEVYASAGYKTPAPPSTISNWRKEAVPPSEQQLFELKPKEFSKVMIEPAGAYIYQVLERKKVPLASVKTQIESTMTNERLRQLVDGLMAGVKPEVNQAYFGAIAAAQSSLEGGPMPNSTSGGQPAQRPEPVSPTPKSTPSVAAKPK